MAEEKPQAKPSEIRGEKPEADQSETRDEKPKATSPPRDPDAPRRGWRDTLTEARDLGEHEQIEQVTLIPDEVEGGQNS